MSDNLHRVPLGVFALLGGAQIGAAVYDGWKYWKRPDARREETDYEKVQKGAVIRGWKTTVSRDRIGKKHDLDFHYHCCVLPPWRSCTDPVSPIEHDLSLLMRFIDRMPDGQFMYVLCRYSLIADDVDSTIIRLVYSGKDWWYELTCYLTDRLVAVLFRRRVNFDRYRVVIVDTIAKTSRILTIQSPLIAANDIDVLRLLLSKNGLTVMFSSMMFAENDVGDMNEFKRVFCNATYEIPTPEPVRASNRSTPHQWKRL